MKSGPGIQVNSDEAVECSKCGTYLAVGYRNRLRIYVAESIDVVREFVCRQTIKRVNWCCDSDHVLCVVEDGRVESFSLAQPDWVCTVDNGDMGVTKAAWSPNGFHILTLSEFHVRIIIWSLVGKSITFIDTPILKKDQTFPFTPDGTRFGVITKSDDMYKILVFSTSSWSLQSKIDCPGLTETIPFGPLWSPTNQHLVVWDTLDMNAGLLHVYSTDNPHPVSTFRNTARLSGVTKVSWTPSGQFLLIGACNDSIHVLNYITWSVLTIRSHSQVIDGGEWSDVSVESENERDFKSIQHRPVVMSRLKDVPRGRLPGVADIVCDPTGRYVATTSTVMPAVVWLWDIGTFAHVSTVILQRPVSHLEWTSSSLLVCTKSNGLVRWRRDRICRVRFPASSDLIVSSCGWSGAGQLSILSTVFLYIITGFNP